MQGHRLNYFPPSQNRPLLRVEVVVNREEVVSVRVHHPPARVEDDDGVRVELAFSSPSRRFALEAEPEHSEPLASAPSIHPPAERVHRLDVVARLDDDARTVGGE